MNGPAGLGPPETLAPRSRSAAVELIVVADGAAVDSPGGVQLKVKRILQVSAAAGPKVRAVPAERIPDHLGGGNDRVVFLQSEGGRDRTVLDLIDRCLALGARVVELNIFALGISDRPDHPRYVPAFLSRDGFHRHVLRCAAEGRRPRRSALILPNPLLHPVRRRAPREPDGELRILRIGRPDPVKWTSFEVDLAKRLSAAHRELQVRLRLVGAPEGVRSAVSDAPPNLRVEFWDYAADVSDLYSWSDLYLHHSRIGETYGNTLLEAALSGVPVACALDPSWDCAPLEFLGEGNVLATPAALLRKPETVLDLVGADPVCPRRDLGADIFVERVLSAAADPGRLTSAPSLAEALRYLADTAQRLDGRRRSALPSAGRQALRAATRRVRGG